MPDVATVIQNMVNQAKKTGINKGSEYLSMHMWTEEKEKEFKSMKEELKGINRRLFWGFILVSVALLLLSFSMMVK